LNLPKDDTLNGKAVDIKSKTLVYKRNCELTESMSFPSSMSRIALGVEYDGSDFYGFQRQSRSDNTVQGKLEYALSKVADENITLVCAGRTDSGVHAHEQIVHFDTTAARPDKAWVRGVNTHLPESVRVHWCKNVGSKFHARFGARSRTYRYIIYSAPVAPAVLRTHLTWTPHSLNLAKMRAAASLLEGTHNFDAFRASGCQAKSPIRTVDYAKFFESGHFLVFEIRANAFLQHMVRNIVGSLLEVGVGKQDVSWVAELLASENRCLGAATAESCGLYFVKVDFDKSFDLPHRSLGPTFIA